MKPFLASDNWAATHPLILDAILKANEGSAVPYGDDPWTQETGRLLEEVFGRPCKVHIVPTGSGSNVFAFKLACKPYESIVCTDIAHINTQETGSAESLVGCKLLTVPHAGGKLTPHAVRLKIQQERSVGKHCTSPRILSATQPTEAGTVYTLEELAALATLCHEENLLLHIDGSRLYNAAVHLGVSLNQLAVHVDLLSLGGTKNGLMGAEALVIFNPSLHTGSDHLHKQMLQLPSKMRYLSAQYIPFFKDKLWHTCALNANQKAQEIGALVAATPGLRLSYPVETNQVFFTAPPAWIPLIQEQITCYLWDATKGEIRLIASWNTSDTDLALVKKVFASLPPVQDTKN